MPNARMMHTTDATFFKLSMFNVSWWDDVLTLESNNRKLKPIKIQIADAARSFVKT